MFPEEDLLGVDLVIPDISYLKEKKDKVRAILLTHGHEDHIGALPYVLRDVQVPVYGTRLTLGSCRPFARTPAAGQRVGGGSGGRPLAHRGAAHSSPFTSTTAFRMSSRSPSRPPRASSCSPPTSSSTIRLSTAVPPISALRGARCQGRACAVLRLDQCGEGPATRSRSESSAKAFTKFSGRPTGGSSWRLSHLTCTACSKCLTPRRQSIGKVCVVGRSMINVVRIAPSLAILNFPTSYAHRRDLRSISYPHEQVVVLSTGSQGEPMAALSRMAAAEHRQIEIVPGDTVIISAHPIPGNERLVGRTINQLYKLGRGSHLR